MAQQTKTREHTIISNKIYCAQYTSLFRDIAVMWTITVWETELQATFNLQ